MRMFTTMPPFARKAAILAAALAMNVSGFAGPAAADPFTLRVGNPQSDSFSFVPLEIGRQLGIFAKYNIELDIKTFAGSAELEEALASGTVEIALGSGTEFAFIPQGAPDTAVATLAVRPSLLVVSARPDAGIAAVDDLKGQSIGVTASDPLPAWLVGTLSEDRGWGPDGIKALPLDEPLVTGGAINPSVAGIVIDLPSALGLEDRGAGRTIANFGDVVTNFPFYVAFARNDLIETNQDAVKNFLTGWFETVKWMQDNRNDTVTRVAAAIGTSEQIASTLYDKLMPAYSPDGKFDTDALKILARALVTMKVLDREQDLGRYIKQDILGAGCSNR